MAHTELDNNITVDSNYTTKFAYPDLVSIVKIFFIFLFYSVVLGIVMGVFLALFRDQNIKSPQLGSFIKLIAYTLTILITIWYAIRKARRKEGASFRINFNGIDGWLIPVFILSTLALVVGLERFADLIPMPASAQKFFEKLFTKDVFSIITMVIAAPVLEEILCRGIVLRGLLKRYSPNQAIVISALFFAVLHMNPWQAMPAFIGGLFLGWVYYRTKSVFPGMIIHATINGTGAIFLFFPHHEQSFLSLLGMPYYLALCVVAVMVFFSGCFIIHKRTSTV